MAILSHLRKFLSKKPLINITYGITVCNEHEELGKLLQFLMQHKRENDVVLVLQDITIASSAVNLVIEQYKGDLIHRQSKLEGDFATFKNELIACAKGDYLFQIDADELPSLSLMERLPSYLSRHSKYDCLAVPRLNTVEGIENRHLKAWNWTINEDGYINYPDYQDRIIKLSNTAISWRNKVHEVLSGYKLRKELPRKKYKYCLIHAKKIERQVRQNDFYDRNF